jgi:hypothetical protein
MNLPTIVALTAELVGLIGVLIPVIVSVSKIANGTKCQLRSEMLRIYYAHKDEGVIRQFEYENFMMLYESYKVLKGNSFITDKVYPEVKKWKIES